LSSVLNDTFGEKGVEIADKNVQAARAGYDYVAENSDGKFKRTVRAISGFKGRILLTGNEAVASSALISGCKFMSGYPMSPSTPIQQFFASNMQDHDVVFEQGEDEISVIKYGLRCIIRGG